MKKVTCLVAAAAAMAMVSAPAAAREFADIYTECGLGALIAPRNGAVAAVTNVTWDLGTTAISSNASSADTCAGGKQKTAAFIVEQYAQIERDLAQGQGKHLEALLAIAGCPADAAHTLRAGFAASVASPAYATQTRLERAESLYDQVQQSACQAG
jgi:hypothetical protein